MKSIWKQYPQEKPDFGCRIFFYHNGRIHGYLWHIKSVEEEGILWCYESDLITSITSSVASEEMVETLKKALYWLNDKNMESMGNIALQEGKGLINQVIAALSTSNNKE